MTKEEWYEQLFDRLEHSKFRSGFHLKKKDIDYINEKGLDTDTNAGTSGIYRSACDSYLLSGMYPQVA